MIVDISPILFIKSCICFNIMTANSLNYLQGNFHILSPIVSSFQMLHHVILYAMMFFPCIHHVIDHLNFDEISDCNVLFNAASHMGLDLL